LVKILEHRNVWHRRTAQRILSERGEGTFGRSLHQDTPVHELLKNGKSVDGRLAALWTLHGMNELDEGALNAAARDMDPAVRAWAARLTGERGLALQDSMDRLEGLAKDEDITVRASVAVAARQYVSSSLTIN